MEYVLDRSIENEGLLRFFSGTTAINRSQENVSGYHRRLSQVFSLGNQPFSHSFHRYCLVASHVYEKILCYEYFTYFQSLHVIQLFPQEFCERIRKHREKQKCHWSGIFFSSARRVNPIIDCVWQIRIPEGPLEANHPSTLTLERLKQYRRILISKNILNPDSVYTLCYKK